jgi:DNA polymerase-3 subunit delta
MAGTTSAITYLMGKRPAAPKAVNILFGNDPYLKKAVLTRLTGIVLPENDDEFSLTRIDVSAATWRDVVDALATRSLFGDGKRLVTLEDADDFVKEFRPSIEKYTKEVATDSILVFTVKTWQKNTRIYKELEKTGLQIDCSAPKPAQLVKWLQYRADSLNGFKLSADSAREMIEIVGCEVGLLDQELEKMMLTVDPDTRLTPAEIQKRIGGWRTKKVWDMLDAACDGNVADAMKQLERLIYAGEHPIAILGQVAFPLRKFALAASIYRTAEREHRKISLSAALERAGVQRYFLADTERRLKRLGRDRAAALYRWLLEADIAMKGVSSRADRARIVLEQLITRIAVPRSANLHASPQMPRMTRSG